MAGRGRPSPEEIEAMRQRRAQLDSMRTPPEPRPFLDSYDEARERAGITNRRVLVAWVPDDSTAAEELRARLREEEQVAGKVSWEYETVWASPALRQEPSALASLWQSERDTLDAAALPALTVLDGAGTVLGRLEGWSEPRDLFAFLLRHQAPYPDVAAELERVQEEAKESDRLYFEYFVDQDCEPCDLLDRWLIRPRVVEVWSEVFVNLRVDVSRSINGGALYRANMGMRTAPAGFPYFVAKRPSGRAIGDSRIMPKNGNVGFPWSDEEITAFAAWLERRIDGFDKDQREVLIGEILAMRGGSEGGVAPPPFLR
jgi:hypothetical protein